MTEQTALVHFNANAIAEYGNAALRMLLIHEMRKEAAEQELADASNRDKTIDAEFVRAAMFLHQDGRVDLLKVYGDKKDTESLYKSILLELGIFSREVTDDDKVVYDFTDPELKGAYSFEQAIANYKFDAEKEESPRYTLERIQEERQKRARRNALNTRLQRVCKAALELVEAKATPDDIQTIEKDNGETAIVLTKGPKTIMGKSKSVEIASGNVAKVEGAEFTPTVTGLAKAADARHKPASKQTTEHAQPTQEQDLTALLNAALVNVEKREGTFTDQEKTIMKNLLTALQKYVK